MKVLGLIGVVFTLLFIYGLFSKKLSSLSISGPMIFTLFGLFLHPFITIPELHMVNGDLELVGKIALIVILFNDANTIPLTNFFKIYTFPVRLLFVGLPLTMLIGSLIAIYMFPTVPILLLILMAIILSPTDAALGQAVVKSKKIPLVIRETINVESGLNDGLALPPILICIVLFSGEVENYNNLHIWSYVSKQLLIAPVIGVVIGAFGSTLINWADSKKYATSLFQGIGIGALSIISFVAAEHMGGNGYIAAFTSGLTFKAQNKKLLQLGEEYGEFLSQPLSLFVFFIFGLSVIPKHFKYINSQVLIYSILSLTLIRVIPVIISLIGTKTNLKSKLFIAWFGPRGIASILYLLMSGQMLPKSIETQPIFSTIVLTVFLSIFFHGITAVPYSNWLVKTSNKK